MRKIINVLLLGLLMAPFTVEAKYSDLVTAIKKKDMKLFNEAISKKNVNVNETYKDGKTPLMLAAEKDQYQMFKILLDKGANPLAKSTYRDTALIIASESSNQEMVRILLDKICGSAELLDKIVSASKEQVNIYKNKTLNTEISKEDLASIHNELKAASFNPSEEEKATIEKLKNYLNIQDSIYETALMVAIEFKREETAKLLLHAGTNPFAKDDYGEDAETYAKKKASAELLSLVQYKKELFKMGY